jgi:hypothetical protein
LYNDWLTDFYTEIEANNIIADRIEYKINEVNTSASWYYYGKKISKQDLVLALRGDTDVCKAFDKIHDMKANKNATLIPLSDDDIQNYCPPPIIIQYRSLLKQWNDFDCCMITPITQTSMECVFDKINSLLKVTGTSSYFFKNIYPYMKRYECFNPIFD